MRVALCGATGRAGSRILDELLNRDHQVLAIARQEGTLSPRAGVTVAVDDLADGQSTAQIIRGTDAFLSAYAPPSDDPEQLTSVTHRLIEATASSGTRRFLMVGGAGTLEVAPGLTLLQSGKLPAEWQPIASAHAHSLDILRACSVDWTSLSPAIYFDPGKRTGHFRLGTDNLIIDANGDSRISMEDFAIALVDELETPKHVRQRFSIGY